MSFGECERLSPDKARLYLQDLTSCMSTRAHRLAQDEDCDEIEYADNPSEQEQKPSPMKQLYGDKWSFLCGIVSGIEKMKEGSEPKYDEQSFELARWDVDDYKWQEHYDEYGYGKYADGLEIGKKLAFYKDKSFDLSADVEQESDNSFTFTDYSE